MQNPLTNALLMVMHRIANSVLNLDPDGKRSLAQLHGKVFCLQIREPQITLYLLPTEQGLEFRREVAADATPHVTLTGSAFAFARLGRQSMVGMDAANFFADGTVTMQGDAELGQALQKVLSELDLDWEELLSRLFGDGAAHQIGNVLRGLAGWASNSVAFTRENAADYLTEEKQILPSKLSVERFDHAVHCARADVERLTLRVARLKQSAQANSLNDSTK